MKLKGTLRMASLALLAGVAACAAGRNYHDAGMDFGSVKTVAVLPFANLSTSGVAAERVRDALSAALLATGALYVVPPGEVNRALGRLSVSSVTTPSTEEVVKLCQLLKADAAVAGVVREYGEVRSGQAVGNIVSLSVRLQEGATGKVVWEGVSTRGGIGFWARLFGTGGAPMNDVTEAVVDDIVAKLFK
jgi:hypothetical protein